jgi:hypothetical protein
MSTNSVGQTQVKPLEVLQECASYKAPAIILNTETGIRCHVRIQSASRENVVLELMEPWMLVAPRTIFCISFRYRNESLAFASKLLEARRSPFPGTLVIELPPTICGIEARSAFRVPVLPKSGLLINIINCEGARFIARPVNLSLTGILVNFEDLLDPELELGPGITAELTLAQYTVKLAGEVRNRNGHEYGILFREVITSKGFAPPEELREIFAIVEHM